MRHLADVGSRRFGENLEQGGAGSQVTPALGTAATRIAAGVIDQVVELLA
jgi:hypothetical protein